MSGEAPAGAGCRAASRSGRRAVAVRLAWVYGPFGLLVGAVGAVALLSDVPTNMLTRDITDIGRLPLYAGAVSQLGLQLWGATAALCLFSAGLLRARRAAGAAAPEAAVFLASSGLFTLLVLLDDGFALHALAKQHLGPAAMAVYAAYLPPLVLIGWRCRRVLRASELDLLLPALALLAASAGVDAALGLAGASGGDAGARLPAGPWLLLEDGLKLLGIGGWFGFHARFCHRALAGPPPGRPPAQG